MLLKIFPMGAFEVNTYVIGCEKTKDAAIIDFGGEDLDKIVSFLTSNNYTLKYLLLTHGHLDHVSGAKQLQTKFNIPIYMHKEDLFLVESLETFMSMYGLPPEQPPNKLSYVNHNNILNLGEIEIKVIHTPGHSPGSLCYYIPTSDLLFSGDTVFEGSIGRTDLPGGSHDKLIKSVEDWILTLPDNVTIYPGHGPKTTVGVERIENPFFGTKSRHKDSL